MTVSEDGRPAPESLDNVDILSEDMLRDLTRSLTDVIPTDGLEPTTLR